MTLSELATKAKKFAKGVALATPAGQTYQAAQKYFAPTSQVRVRDVIRETPRAIVEVAKQLPRDMARFGISAIEAPRAIKTGQATGKFYNTPLGRINSFQSEAQNRVNRGDPLWKAIGNPALETVLAGSDIGALSKPLFAAAKNLKGFGALGDEIRALAGDMTVPLGRTMKLKVPARVEQVSPNYTDLNPGGGVFRDIKGKLTKVGGFRMGHKQGPVSIPESTVDVPFEFQSKTLRIRPGMSIEDVSKKLPTEEPFDAKALLLGTDEKLSLPAGRDATIKEAKQIFKKTGDVVPFKNVLKPNGKVLEFGETGANFKKIRITGGEGQQRKVNLTPYPDAEFKDITPTSKGFRDVYRNFEQFFGKNYKAVKKNVLDRFDDSKNMMFKNLETHADDLDKNIVSGLGIKKGSKESAAVQEFGEGNLKMPDLVKRFGEKRAKDIVKADQWFRSQYDRMLGEVNAIRAKVYPNDPTKQIPKRSDYYRHFREMKEGFAALSNIFDGPAGVAPNLAGVSQYTKPKSKWLSFAQARLGTKTDIDAVGGFLDYANAAEYAKNIDPNIGNFRKLQDGITRNAEKSGKDYSNMIEFLQDFTDDLAGKTNPIDRPIQKYIPGGRKAMAGLTWLNSRVKANTILGNASSALAQIFAVPQGIANAGEKNYIKGLHRLGKSLSQNDEYMKQSGFIRERFYKADQKFDTGIFQNTKKFAVWMITALDELGTKANWMAFHEKAVAEGIANPIRYADDMARKMIGGRGIGEVPIAQKSKAFQLIAPFQLEVANQWHVMKSLANKKDAGKLMKMFAYTWMFNRVVEQVRGSDVAFDPIQALIEGGESFNEEEDKGTGALKFAGRLGGEVLSNLPLGQTAASIYPEFGFKVGDKQMPVREDFFGEGDPTRFGSGLLVAKGLQDPLARVLPPFGGVQVKRAIDGIKAYKDGYSESKTGRIQYPIEKNRTNAVKSAIFGKYSLPEAREYFDSEGSPLGDVQSEKFKMMPTEQANAFFNKIQNNRLANKEKEALKSGKSKSNIANASEIPGVSQLLGGEFYVADLDKTFKTPEAADFAIKKNAFEQSDKNQEIIGDKVLRKNEDGTVTTTKKAVYDTQLINKKINVAKDKKDLATWFKHAETKAELLNKQLADPNTDELERITLQDQLDTLTQDAEKYAGYGGFTKPKATKKGKKVKMPKISLSAFSTARPKAPSLKSPKVSLSQGLPKTQRIKLPKINISKINYRQNRSSIPGSKRLA